MNLVEALEVIIDDEHLEDFIYHVRERASYDPGRNSITNSWELPRVKRFGKACKVLKDELRRLQNEVR